MTGSVLVYGDEILSKVSASIGHGAGSGGGLFLA